MAVPVPKAWNNGDDLLAATLNTQWRDMMLWLSRKGAPAFSGYNTAAPTLTVNVGIPLITEEVKYGGITHAASDSKVFVTETGWYTAYTQVGGGMTGTGTMFCSELRKNGAIESQSESTRVSGSGTVAIGHMSSVRLVAGDYVEVALGGTFTGTATAIATAYGFPALGLWWRAG
jgi:hypothetical protein